MPAKMGVRIDSGDISYLTKGDGSTRACWSRGLCVVPTLLRRWLIRNIILERAKVNSFGVGERPNHS